VARKVAAIETVGEKNQTSAKRIMDAISENKTIKREELSLKTGLSVSGAEYQIEKLKNQHRLERIGPTKGGFCEIVDS